MIIPPCPCGGKAKLQKEKKADGDMSYLVVCQKCGAQGCSTFSSDFAIYMWDEGYIAGVNGERLSNAKPRKIT